MAAKQKTASIEVWVVIDENGDYATGNDRATALESYDNNIGRDDSEPLALRWVKTTLKVPLPNVVELSGTVPANEGPAWVSMAQSTGEG